MNNITVIAAKTLFSMVFIYAAAYLFGSILTPIVAIIYGGLTAQIHLAIGSAMAFILASISPLGWSFYLVPGSLSTIVSVLFTTVFDRRPLFICLCGIAAPFAFYWWYSQMPSHESVMNFLIIPICLSSGIAFSTSAFVARAITSQFTPKAEQDAAANP